MLSIMTKTTDISQHEFCKFATELYEQPKAKEILRDMQQRLGLNPNLIMFCCWVANNGQKQISKNEMHHIITVILPWHEYIVLNLRKTRKKLSTNNLFLDKLIEIETKANNSEQIMLTEMLIKSCHDRTMLQKFNDAYKNINMYFKTMRLTVYEQEANMITKLLELIWRET